MQKSYVELFKELETLDRQESERVADFQFKRQQIVTDLSSAIATPGIAVVVPSNGAVAPAGSNGTPKKRGAKKKATAEGSATPSTGPTTKQHILNVLRRSRTGLDLRGIVAEMTRMKESGEWQTETESVTGVVSQAMNGLRKDKFVKVEKNNETNRNVYMAIPQPA